MNEPVMDPIEAAEAVADSGIMNNPAPAIARMSDPATSHQAANLIRAESMRKAYKQIIRTLGMTGPQADFEIVQAQPVGMQSESGWRTRRKELERAGYIVAGEYKKRNTRGLWTQVWCLTDTGKALFMEWTGLNALEGGGFGEGKTTDSL